MKSTLFASLLLSTLMVGVSPAWAAWPSEKSAVQLKGGETPAVIEAAYQKAIAAIAGELGYGGNANKALQRCEATIHQAARPGAEAERSACCRAVATALESGISPEAKGWLLNQVTFVGRSELVASEAALLSDAASPVREQARRALEHNPAPEAAAALRQALERATDPDWQASLALALGTRGDTASIPAIARLLSQQNERAVEAALFALGQIGNAEAAKMLAMGRDKVPAGLRAAAAESWMRCAERLLKSGQTEAAAAVYRELYRPVEPRPLRLAALRGVLTCSGDGTAVKILDLLAGDDADARALAAGFVQELGPGGLQALAAGMNRLPVETQISLLGTLAARGEKSALPVALAFAKESDERTRAAGLAALGRLGDVSAVPVLAEAMRKGGSAAGTAKESLTRLAAQRANEEIVSRMRAEEDPARRAALIEVIEARGASTAVPALTQEIVSPQSAVRRAAMRALGKLAQPQDVPALVKGLMKTAQGGEREDAEKAIAAACARTTEAGRQAEPVLRVYEGASPAERLMLVPVLGRIGGSKALEAVKTALASNEPATFQAGVAAISNWPDADTDVEEQLLSLTQRADKSERSAAVRAYIRLVTQPSGLPEQERLRKLKKAMELADNDQDRNFVLERAADIKRIETLRFVAPYLEQAALATRAGHTICDLAREGGLRSGNRAEFEKALSRVVEVSKDQSLTDRAKRRLEEK